MSAALTSTTALVTAAACGFFVEVDIDDGRGHAVVLRSFSSSEPLEDYAHAWSAATKGNVVSTGRGRARGTAGMPLECSTAESGGRVPNSYADECLTA